MKKYKLIKEYPGCIESGIGTIAYNYIEQGPNKYHYTNFQKPNENPICNNRGWIDFEKYPEFWEEIIEKDYEILSLRFMRTIYQYKDPKDNDKYWYSSCFSVKEGRGYVKLSNINKDSVIHSVKRLSDGEIFTTGDKYYQNQNPKKSSIIESFIIKNNNLIIYSKDLAYSYLCETSKAKKPLFITEDGVEIFNFDKCYFVHSNLNRVIEFIALENTNTGKVLDNGKDFSTIEAAEKYIFENKPVLSISDLVKHGVIVPIKLRNEIKKRINNA